ncbi:15-hydroxyprostaglandin dehydrogenase [NAD(+)] [Plakobranchus ocellatus]|uniref:15-hydroxyprostaglandin dehydrogenase [NAD(+)] n=1 Tax=Plakobranchus ocellatus TaxID=259542 RepID=A0AAV3YHS2_9GAST|nr:15-hydroxyprostaglandin dehydrogenase [NAD(+)] [Plakobranchus ocellatus]
MATILKTKNVFLTGGACGLGKGFTDSLLAAAARVIFTDVNRTAAEATEKEFQDKYGKDNVKFIECDVTDGPKFEETFQTAISFLGHVDLMVNNAGMMVESKWERMIDVNYKGVVRGTLMAVEHMRQDKGGKGGRIINISSEAGLKEMIFMPIYGGTKHAVRCFTSCLATAPDVKAQGIEYGTLCPGPVDTDLIRNLDETKIRHSNLMQPERLKERTSSVERLQEAFMKLVLLEEMNKAILYVDSKEENFYEMKANNLGPTWPADSTDLSSQ